MWFGAAIRCCASAGKPNCIVRCVGATLAESTVERGLHLTMVIRTSAAPVHPSRWEFGPRAKAGPDGPQPEAPQHGSVPDGSMAPPEPHGPTHEQPAHCSAGACRHMQKKERKSYAVSMIMIRGYLTSVIIFLGPTTRCLASPD